MTGDVMKATDRRQEPFTYGSLPDEEFYFKPPTTPGCLVGAAAGKASAPCDIREPAGPNAPVPLACALERGSRCEAAGEARRGKEESSAVCGCEHPPHFSGGPDCRRAREGSAEEIDAVEVRKSKCQSRASRETAASSGSRMEAERAARQSVLQAGVRQRDVPTQRLELLNSSSATDPDHAALVQCPHRHRRWARDYDYNDAVYQVSCIGAGLDLLAPRVDQIGRHQTMVTPPRPPPRARAGSARP